MSELKPCPFCGGEATIQPEGDYHEIHCEDCGIELNRRTYDETVTAWNTRAETEAERKIEKVREKLESLKNDARMMNEAESIALDYVTDFLLEILEDDNENQRKSD